MQDDPLVRITGDVEQPLELSHAQLSSLAEINQVRDVSRLDSRRQGDGVTLAAVLAMAKPSPAASHLTLLSSGDKFAASIPLEAVRDRGVLIYQFDNRPLQPEEGGPIRFLITDSAACNTDELDDCANVKFVDRIELGAGKGHDTRR